MLRRFLSGITLAVIAIMAVPLAHASDAGAATQTTNVGGVKVTVTAPDFMQQAQSWEFEVALETHTRDLGDDLSKVSTLVAEGKRYTPIEWQGAPPGGHHRKGKLVFRTVTPRPSSMELQIHLVGEAVPRSFRWALNGTSNGKGTDHGK